MTDSILPVTKDTPTPTRSIRWGRVLVWMLFIRSKGVPETFFVNRAGELDGVFIGSIGPLPAQSARSETKGQPMNKLRANKPIQQSQKRKSPLAPHLFALFALLIGIVLTVSALIPRGAIR